MAYITIGHVRVNTNVSLSTSELPFFPSAIYSIRQAVIFDVNERTRTERNEYLLGHI